MLKEITVRCANNHVFTRPAFKFKTQPHCPQCKLESKQNFINSLGYKIISSTIGDNLEVECVQGHKFKRCYSNFEKGTVKCTECDKFKIDEKVNRIRGFGFEIISKNMSNKMMVRCISCKYEFHRSISNFNKVNTCPSCSPNNISSHELELRDFLDVWGIKYITSDRIILEGLELDVYLPEYKIAIEYNGVYYHSEMMGRGSNYHLNKTTMCDAKGINLFHVNSNEWMNNRLKNVWQNIILNVTNKLKPPPLSHGYVVDIVDVVAELKYLEINNIGGICESEVCYGLYCEGNIIAMCGIEINDDGVNILYIVGTLGVDVSKLYDILLDYILKIYKRDLIYYENNRYRYIPLQCLGFTKSGIYPRHHCILGMGVIPFLRVYHIITIGMYIIRYGIVVLRYGIIIIKLEIRSIEMSLTPLQELPKFDQKISNKFLNKIASKYRIIFTVMPMFYTLNDGSILCDDETETACKLMKECKTVKIYTEVKPHKYKDKHIKYIVDTMFVEFNKLVNGNPIVYVMGGLNIRASKTEDGVNIRSYSLRFTV